MKIAVVVWELNIKGGTQRQALELAVNLQKSGHEVIVYCYVFDKKDCYDDLCSKLNIRYVETKREIFREHKIISMVMIPFIIIDIMLYDSASRKLKKMILEDSKIEKFDVINIHDQDSWRIARHLKHEKIVWMMNDMIVIPFFDLKIEEDDIAKSIYWKAASFIIRHKIKNIDKIVVLDNYNKALCKKYYKRDSVVVRSGINTHLFDSIKIDKNNNKIEIFANSIFFRHRRFEDLVLAIKILRDSGVDDFHVTINGKNARCYDYYLFIKKLIEENGLVSYISIINGMSEKELLESYARANIFVFPNHNQTWGLAVFEAMLAECVCIVSRSSGAHEVLSDGENALFVSPKNPSELADKIKYAINNYSDCLRIGKNGSSFVKNNLSWDKYANSMSDIFNED